MLTLDFYCIFEYFFYSVYYVRYCINFLKIFYFIAKARNPIQCTVFLNFGFIALEEPFFQLPTFIPT